MPASSKTAKPRTSSASVKKSPRKSNVKATQAKAKRAMSEEEFSDSNDDDSDVYEAESKEESDSEPESLDSDDLDDDKPATRKRKRTAAASSPRKKATPKGRKAKKPEDDEDFDDEAEDGVEIVGRVVQAPTTGRVMQRLMGSKQEWVDFVDKMVEKVSTDVDEEVPPLPAKDVIHRIYRDVRFSNDKTPYKTNFSASFSRSGRKGIFAHYHVASAVASGGRSLVAAGLWCPGKNELATFRSHILRDSTPLRNVLSEKEFVKFFGPPKKHAKGERQSVFGHEDELKVAPKGIDKNHKDIDLLKVRSPAVIHRFLDSEVLDPDFIDKLCGVMRVMQPFVHLLNEMVTVPPEDASDDEE
ncbi:hypothetical protein FS837_011561 [Tulasnella sp. UAMH 9824]|nr:hypothetical protein FS837_011561 [Tulasnella sp. UAMH 9824]